MENPIIDASNATLAHYLQRHARSAALRRYLWYRVARPLLVAAIWVMAALYVHWCVTAALRGEFTLRGIVPDVLVVLGMIAALTLWTTVRRLEQSVSGAARPARAPVTTTLDLARDVVLAVGPSRRLVAYHDDDGLISRVAPLQQELA
ncbi:MULTISPECIES: hypothetical protein [Cupriavidus]